METKREIEPRAGGVRLGLRFALAMTVALSAVTLVAGFVLYQSTATLVRTSQDAAFVEALYALNGAESYEQIGSEATQLAGGQVRRFKVRHGENSETGYLYQLTDKKDGLPLVAPADVVEKTGRGLLGLVIGVTVAVILAGALVAFTVGNQVTRPLEQIVEDIRQISRGDLEHRTRVRAGGEIAMLARSVDRMAGSLHEAQEAQVELSVRERELALAGEVREALLPDATPVVPGYDLGALHVGSATPGGAFHDFVERGDGRVGLLVCDVSGRGIPGALVGATARAYLRVELAVEDDVALALRRVNVQLARDVRRGMYVTALYAALDPRAGTATVACAGHKVPLVRYTAADRKIRLIQPEGIALGFDKGPLFDNALKPARVDLAPGDRILLANTGALAIVDPSGAELGEKAFYHRVLQVASRPTVEMLQMLKRALETYAGGAPFPSDVTLVTVFRQA